MHSLLTEYVQTGKVLFIQQNHYLTAPTCIHDATLHGLGPPDKD